MYKNLIRKIALITVSSVMIVTSTTLVAFAQSNEKEEIAMVDSTLFEEELINHEDQVEVDLALDNEVLDENTGVEINEEDKTEEDPFDVLLSSKTTIEENKEQYYIKDPILREIINAKLYKEEGHNPTPSELESITYLKIAPKSGFGFNSKSYLEISSFEGIEYLVNLNNLIIQNVIMPESAIEDISKSSSIEYLYIEYSFFTGRNDVSTILVNTSINEAPKENIELPFSSYVSFEPLSNLSNLKQIQITRNGSVYDGTEFGKALTGYDLTGWEKLSELNYIWIEGASSFNDNSLKFIKFLPKINEITLYNTSLNSLEHFADLREENFQRLQLRSNDVLDYTPVIDKKFFLGSSENTIKDVLEFYSEEEVNGELGKYISVNTGIVLADNLQEVKLGSYTMFQNSMNYLGYENIDGVLYLNFEIKDLVNFKHKSIDEEYHGFMVNVNLIYNTKRGTTNLEFDLPVNIGKRVDFVFSEEDMESIFVKPFELIEPIDNPTRPGYEFVEWTEDKEGTKVFDFSIETYDNQTIYAQWKEINKFTVTFDSNGGTLVTPLTNVEKNSVIDEPEEPTKNNYHFMGWFKDVDLSNEWNFSVDRVTENTILYAKWESVYAGRMYNLEANDGTINLSDLEDTKDLMELQEKIIEATQAKGYKIDRDGNRTDMTVYVKDLNDILSIDNENYKDVELTLLEPNKRLASSDDINEANVTVKIYINDDTEKEEKPSVPEDTNASTKPSVPTQKDPVNNPSTGVSVKRTSYLVMIVISLMGIVSLKKKKDFKF